MSTISHDLWQKIQAFLTHGKDQYLVEWFIDKITHYRRVCSYFENLKRCYMSFFQCIGVLNLVMIKIKCQHNLVWEH